MSLTFTEVFAIQAAIDAYETKFPDRPSLSPEEALAWQAGGRRRKLLSGLVLHDAMQTVLNQWLESAKVVKEPFTPWKRPTPLRWTQ